MKQQALLSRHLCACVCAITALGEVITAFGGAITALGEAITALGRRGRANRKLRF
jgi:hypothetical protein